MQEGISYQAPPSPTNDEYVEAISKVSFEMSRLTRRAYNDLSTVTVYLRVFELQKDIRDREFAETNFKKMIKEDGKKTPLRFYYHYFDEIDHEHLKQLQNLLIHQVIFFNSLPEQIGEPVKGDLIKNLPISLSNVINQNLSVKTPDYWSRSPETKLIEIMSQYAESVLNSREFSNWINAIRAHQKSLPIIEK